MVTETALSVKGPKLFPWEQPETCLDPGCEQQAEGNTSFEKPDPSNTECSSAWTASGSSPPRSCRVEMHWGSATIT